MSYITVDITPRVCSPGKTTTIATPGDSAAQNQKCHRGRIKRENLSFNPFIFQNVTVYLHSVSQNQTEHNKTP